MTSTVMTGRRTKSSDRFMDEDLRLDHDLRPGPETQLALRYDLLAFFQTVRDDRAVALGGHIGLDHENVLAIGTGLNRFGRHDQGVFLVVELDPHVDELARPQRVLPVLELRPQFDPAAARMGIA